jgi:myo-inositol catabolism protein IolC
MGDPRSGPLAILAFDHRASFLQDVIGVDPRYARDEDLARARGAKDVIAEGLLSAVAGGAVDRAAAGALVDPTLGGDALAALRREGIAVAIPVEESGRRDLAFEEGWQERLDELDPTWAKVLLRMNPAEDPAMHERQMELVRELAEVCAKTERDLMLELLVPPEREQEASDYDTGARPGLVLETIAEIRAAGVTPAVWKLEGFERRADAAAVADAAGAPCVVLGRGLDATAVERWLTIAASVPGFIGFAIGRTIWDEPIRAFLAAVESPVARADAVATIAKAYARCMEVFDGAAVGR